MRKLKRLIIPFMVVVMLFSSFTLAGASANITFNDIDGHWAKDYILTLADKGIISGYNGSFFPEDNLTRAQFAKVLVLAKGLDLVSPETPTFSDVSATDANGNDIWYYNYVETAAKAGIVNGYKQADGTVVFDPDGKITREQMAAMIIRALGKADIAKTKATDKIDFTDADKIQDYAKGPVALAVELGIINGMGDNKFVPQGNATRGQAAKILKKFIDTDLTSPMAVLGAEQDLTTLNVVFSETVNKDSAENTNNYIITNDALPDRAVKVTAAVLGDDGMTVRLTTEAQTAGDKLTLTINGVSDLAYNSITNLKIPFTVKDTVKPVFQGLTVVDPITLKLQFSKNVDLASAAFYLVEKGTAIPVGDTIIGEADPKDNSIVKLTLTKAMEAGKEYTIILSGIRDTAGNTMDTTSYSFKVEKDTTAPELTGIEIISPNTLKLNFDRSLATAPAVSSPDFGAAQLTVGALADDRRSVTVTIEPAVTETKTYALTIEGATDLWGNVMEKTVKTVDFTSVDLALAFKGAKILDSTSLEVEFNKSVKDNQTVLNPANYRLVLSNTDNYYNPTAAVFMGTDETKIILTVPELDKGVYTLTVVEPTATVTLNY